MVRKVVVGNRRGVPTNQRFHQELSAEPAPANRRTRMPSSDHADAASPASTRNRRISLVPTNDTNDGAAVADDRRSEHANAQVGRHGRKPRRSLLAPVVGWFARRLHGIRAFVSIAFVVVASIALAWGIKQHVVSSPRFAIKTIRIEGNVRRSVEQVIASAAIKTGDNIFALDAERTRNRLLQDPWIDDARVERNLPSTVTISITEREAAAVVAVDADLYLCTPQGELFKKLDMEDPAGLIVISGLTAAQVAADKHVVTARIRSALELLANYESRGPARQYPPQQVYLDPDGSVRLIVGKSALALHVGKPPYRMKMMRATRVLREVQRQNADPSIVFLDNEAHPERVVVRMR